MERQQGSSLPWILRKHRGWGEEEARLMDLDSDQKVTFEAFGKTGKSPVSFSGENYQFAPENRKRAPKGSSLSTSNLFRGFWC